ncbi:helix-turn-helix domain-containing protein [Caulobacter sp. RHG1]|uniref:helix-turn-helix domain-containing protein n=1 Tax=Caulobacter sp. (strain RHG1) TaxID=2545762 RepID=UPI0015577DBB|nr:helix-turn-helix transcriptional regulator [Caulobacter sp. RHG1]NQE65509.1 hypothetical protein [Caulobacter sp. RHG1]
MAGRSIEPFREIGGRLALVRKAYGLTQRQLAERVGRPASYIAKLELAERRLDVIDLEELARALDLDPGLLLSRLMGKDPI